MSQSGTFDHRVGFVPDEDVDFCESCKWRKYNKSGQWNDCQECIFEAGKMAGRVKQAQVDAEAVMRQWKRVRKFPLWEDHVVLDGFIAALGEVAPVEP